MVLSITTKTWCSYRRRVYLIEFHIDKASSIMKVRRKWGSAAVIVLLRACLSLRRQSPTHSMLHWALDRYFGGGTRLGHFRVLYESLLHWNITVGALRIDPTERLLNHISYACVAGGTLARCCGRLEVSCTTNSSSGRLRVKLSLGNDLSVFHVTFKLFLYFLRGSIISILKVNVFLIRGIIEEIVSLLKFWDWPSWWDDRCLDEIKKLSNKVVLYQKLTDIYCS